MPIADKYEPSPDHLRMLVNLLKLVLVIVAIRIIWLNINPSGTGADHTLKPDRLTLSSQTSHTSDFSSDEKRIAHHFETDTLPGLIRKGLIKKYSRNESGTRIMVAGRVWKQRSAFFKQCLLKELLVYDKVNRYQPRAQIVDSISGLLYAEISPEAEIEFYD